MKPFRCRECGQCFSQRCSMEGHRRKIHQAKLDYKPQQRREVIRVCELCGFSCSKFNTLLHHTESLHPLAFDVIAQLRRRILRSLNWLPISFKFFYICYHNKDLSFDSLKNIVFRFLFPNDFSKCFSRFLIIIKVHFMAVFMNAISQYISRKFKTTFSQLSFSEDYSWNVALNQSSSSVFSAW